MYENANQLSPPCVQAIDRFYDLRSKYWEQNQMIESDAQDAHSGHILFFFFMGLFILMSVIKRMRMYKRAKEMKQFLTALHDNKDLKATVEASTGMAVPEVLACGGCPHTPAKCSSGAACFCKRFLKTAAMFIVIIVSSFFISITSLEITAHIVSSIDGSVSDSNAPPASPFLALTILLIVCSIEVGIFFLLVKGVRVLFLRLKDTINGNGTNRDSNGVPDAAPSAPYMLVCSSSHNEGGGHGPANLNATSRNGIFPPSSTRLQQWRSFALQSFRRGGSSNGNGGNGALYDSGGRGGAYAPLLDSSSHGGGVVGVTDGAYEMSTTNSHSHSPSVTVIGGDQQSQGHGQGHGYGYAQGQSQFYSQPYSQPTQSMTHYTMSSGVGVDRNCPDSYARPVNHQVSYV